MRVLGLLLFTAFSVLGVARADEHPACRDVDFAYRDLSAVRLRTIGGSCEDRATARLYYYRANRRDLVDEAQTLSALSFADGVDRGEQFRAYRMYLVLIEEFSRMWFPRPQERIAFLTLEDERWGDIAELRLRGHDNVADRMEGRLRTP